MPNTTPIETETAVMKVRIDHALDDKLKQECDVMGMAGYRLCAGFPQGEYVFLIFQLTR